MCFNYIIGGGPELQCDLDFEGVKSRKGSKTDPRKIVAQAH